MSDKNRLFVCRPGSSVMVILGLMLAFNAQSQSPALFIPIEQQQLIEQQRNAYLEALSTTNVLEQDDANDAEVTEGFRLNAIINRNGQRLAIINGHTYPERTAQNGIHVHRIYENSVSLTLEQTQQWGRARIGVLYNSADWPKTPASIITIK
jgi:hypothetical protein